MSKNSFLKEINPLDLYSWKNFNEKTLQEYKGAEKTVKISFGMSIFTVEIISNDKVL